MNKEVFLNELKTYLYKMEEPEKNKFIIYYDEMISDYTENGLTEAEAVNKIGNPKSIAEELLENYDSKINSKFLTGSRIWTIILLVLGFPLWGSLLLAGVLLVFSFYLIIWCVPFVTGSASVGFFSTSIIGIIGTPFVMAHNFPTGIIQLGTGIASIGISVLLCMVTIDFAKKLILVTKNVNFKLITAIRKWLKFV